MYLQPQQCLLGDQKITHSFLYMRECPISLLGQDLPCKLHAQITFSPEKQQLCLGVLQGYALQLQVLLACLEVPDMNFSTQDL